MSYSPNTDFIALWRNQTGGAVKAEMPGLDWMVTSLARAGLITLVTSDTAPATNQAKTMWLRPANPTYIGEGALYLWDATATAYVPATPKLFSAYITAIGV
jgi:hypothetical protein